MTAETIISVIVAIIGSGGASAILTAILSARKYGAESDKTKEEANGIHIQNEITQMDYINTKLHEISENSAKESEVLRKRNDVLNKRINDLSDKLQAMMEWVVYDNQNYRIWLETELRKVNPDIEFPVCAPPPKVFQSDDEDETLEE